MLNRDNIRHAAILKPLLAKCFSIEQRGRHSYVKTAEGYEQCIDCGKIKPDKKKRGLTP